MTLPPQYTTRKNELFWLWLIMLKLYLKEKEWQKRYMCIHLTTWPFVLALESTPETKLPLWLGWLLELPRQGWDNPHCISWGEKRFVEIYPSEYYSSINWYVERMTQIIGCYVFLTKKKTCIFFFLLMGWMFCCLGVKTKHSVRVFLFFCFLFWKPVWIWTQAAHLATTNLNDSQQKVTVVTVLWKSNRQCLHWKGKLCLPLGRGGKEEDVKGGI